MAPAQSRIFNFGKEHSLEAAITDAKGTEAPGIGVILWGLGVAEMRIARSLAKLGLVCMQTRDRSSNKWARLDSEGVDRCREAMNELGRRRGVSRFILVGNCASGSICFHTALQEEDVVGLIISNPHVSEMLTFGSSYRRKLFSWRSWKKVLSGRADLKFHVSATRWLQKIFVGRLSGASDKDLADQFTLNKFTTLSPNFNDELVRLTSGGIK